MLIALIVVSILLVLSLVVIITYGLQDNFSAPEWFGTLTFIFCLPLWIIIQIIINADDDKKR